jgi:hypothetical protein
MFKQILFIILFAILISWSVSLQIVLQAIEDKKVRIRVIAMILSVTLLAGLSLTLV